MSIKVIVNVDNPGDLLVGYGAGALLRLERDTTSGFAAPTEVTTVALVPTQTQYEIWDEAGSDASWYRSRVTNAAGSTSSAYSTAWQIGAVRSYATIDSLRELLQLPDTSRDNLLADLLSRVTRKMDSSLGFDFRRHPDVSGTEVRTYDGDGTASLLIRGGVTSLSQVRVARTTGEAWDTLLAGEWVLRVPTVEGGPFLVVKLTGTGDYSRWPKGLETIELTGVFGYPSVPEDIEQAALHWAADLYRVGASGGIAGVGLGLEDLGQPRFLGGMPRITWETVDDYRKLHDTGLVG